MEGNYGLIALLQRVNTASVTIGDQIAGAIGPGLLALVGVERGDTPQQADRLLERVLNYRMFSDLAGKMNFSVRDTAGGLLLVSQFTLAADTNSGNRPSFTRAAAPHEGEKLFAYLIGRARQAHPIVQTGRFGADMQVSLVNDGPVTFWLRVMPVAR